MNAMTNASKKILIADDDASIRLVLSQAFTRLGYQVRATGNATTLLKWVSDGEGDLVVTDVVMPDENVFDVLPRIRDWSDYLDRLAAALRPDAPDYAAPSRIEVTTNARRADA